MLVVRQQLHGSRKCSMQATLSMLVVRQQLHGIRKRSMQAIRTLSMRSFVPDH